MNIEVSNAYKEGKKNWWVDEFSDEFGTGSEKYVSIDRDYLLSHSQFVLLSRMHATMLAQMPREVLNDFDRLLENVPAKKRLAADEIVPYAYLKWYKFYAEYYGFDCPGKIWEGWVMYAPQDSKGLHAILHDNLPSTKLKNEKFMFSRKYKELNPKDREKLSKLWETVKPKIG